MGKILLIVSLVFTLATAALGFLNQGKIATARNEAVAASSDRDKAKADLAKSSADLKAANTSLKTAEAEKEQLSTKATSLEGDLSKAKDDLVAATKQVTDIKGQLDTATKDLEDLKAKVATQPTTPVANNDEALNELKAQVEEKNTLVAKLQTDLEAAQQKSAELQKVDEARRRGLAVKGLEGRILAVNPAWNFVVLDLGDKNGISSNSELLVKRGTQLVGKVRVTSVEPSTSIADIVAKSVPAGTTIVPGDNVIFQAED